jgi:hypothetical protein
MLTMNPSLTTAPTSVLVIDFATDCDVHRPAALCPRA